MALRVGGETQAYCTSCKTMREHLIVALVGGRPAKVECDVCHKQHAYRAGPPGSGERASDRSGDRTERRRTPTARTPSPAPPRLDVAALIAGKTVRSYDPGTRFEVGDAVRHPSFGIGLIVSLPGPQKVEVAFQAGPKLLSHDRASAAASALQRPPVRDDDAPSPPSDAPPRR